MPRIAFAVLALFCCLHLSAATKKPKLAEQYQRWLDQDVVYIITDEERKEFLALDTDAEREKFIDVFWDVRNPKHGSDRNAYKEEHYARIEYANSHFGRDSNTPGWMTDMGRAWILFGPPSRIMRLPATARFIPWNSGCTRTRPVPHPCPRSFICCSTSAATLANTSSTARFSMAP